MFRRNRAPEPEVTAEVDGIPPFLDQFGREVWDNPWGQYRPNPRNGAAAPPAVRSATGLPLIPHATAEPEREERDAGSIR